jgi:hypothetical protein
MPKKKHPETPEEQSKRFRAEVKKLIAAGELDPEKADAAVDALVRKGAIDRQQKTPKAAP